MFTRNFFFRIAFMNVQLSLFVFHILLQGIVTCNDSWVNRMQQV
uniref:Uncharacterized protein n=1 Tax=Phakopsora pachyrhizi TaxID=170000 RepID=A0A0S1MK07_PHAPC